MLSRGFVHSSRPDEPAATESPRLDEGMSDTPSLTPLPPEDQSIATGQAVGPEVEPEETAEDQPIFQAPNVLRIMWADPQHMAEQLVVWSLAHFGPRAEKAVERVKRQHPGASREELEDRVIRAQSRVAAAEGGFVGGPFIVLIPVAFCAALLAQAQMVYELAAVSGRDPRDAMRAADLLVLLGAHDSTAEAQDAIAKMKKNPRQEGKKLPAGARIDMVKHMSYLLGLLAPDPGYSRFRFIIGWIGIGLLLLVGFVLPLVWVPYLAYSTRRSTLRLAARAREYYETGGAADAGLIVRRGEHRASLGGSVALGRTFLLIVLPIGAAVIALLTGTDPGGGRWLFAGLLFIGVSFIASFLWLGLRWLRRTGRRLVRPPRAAPSTHG